MWGEDGTGAQGVEPAASSSRVGRRRERPLVIGRTHQPLDAHRQGRGHGVRSVGEVILEIAVRKPHIGLVGLAQPQPGARRLLENRRGDLERPRQRLDLALQERADRQHVRPPVAVLREVANRELAAVAGSGDELVERIRHEVQRRHAQPRLHVHERQLHLRVARLGPRRRLVRWKAHERHPEIGQQPVVGGGQIDPDGRDVEMIRDQPRVGFVARVAVARHQDADHLARRRHLAQPGHDGRIEPATEADHESVRAGERQMLAQPLGDVVPARRHGHAESSRRDSAAGACGSLCSSIRRKASTSAGSNCFPRCRSISAIASSMGHAAL